MEYCFGFTYSILVIVLFWRRFTQSRVWRRLVLEHRMIKKRYKGTPTYNDLVGKRGVTVTPLRPSGTALIEGQRYSVVSDGGFIKNDVPVEVVYVEGIRIVVREVST